MYNNLSGLSSWPRASKSLRIFPVLITFISPKPPGWHLTLHLGDDSEWGLVAQRPATGEEETQRRGPTSGEKKYRWSRDLQSAAGIRSEGSLLRSASLSLESLTLIPGSWCHNSTWLRKICTHVPLHKDVSHDTGKYQSPKCLPTEDWLQKLPAYYGTVSTQQLKRRVTCTEVPR